MAEHGNLGNITVNVNAMRDSAQQAAISMQSMKVEMMRIAEALERTNRAPIHDPEKALGELVADLAEDLQATAKLNLTQDERLNLLTERMDAVTEALGKGGRSVEQIRADLGIPAREVIDPSLCPTCKEKWKSEQVTDSWGGTRSSRYSAHRDDEGRNYCSGYCLGLARSEQARQDENYVRKSLGVPELPKPKATPPLKGKRPSDRKKKGEKPESPNWPAVTGGDLNEQVSRIGRIQYDSPAERVYEAGQMRGLTMRHSIIDEVAQFPGQKEK